MIEIIEYPKEYKRTMARFQCHECDCVWDADRSSYTKYDKYFIVATCPICNHLNTFYEAPLYEHTYYDDGTMSVIPIEKE